MEEKSLATHLGEGANWTTCLFIALRACDIIDWGFWWVVSPSWILFSIGVTMMVVGRSIRHFASPSWKDQL